MSSLPLRLVRPAPDPFGLYIRAGRVDQPALLNFISSGPSAFSGVVFGAKRVTRQRELLAQVLDRKLDAVLDPQTQQMATIGGFSEALTNLPWCAKRPHDIDDFRSEQQRRQVAEAIARFAADHKFTQVLAPTHLITGPDDPWLAIDIAMAGALRLGLRQARVRHVQIIYSLAVSYEAFRTGEKRTSILDRLHEAEADSIWLRVNGCGADSTPTAVARYLEAASDFHVLDKPIVADHVGGLMGLSLLAFGAVGGIAHGVTLDERFNASHWLKEHSGTPFGLRTRVYIPQLDLMLTRIDAQRLFDAGNRARAICGCRDTNCCARGVIDMLHSPGRHFLYQRTREVAGLGWVPESLRAHEFLEEHLRPASHQALAATRLTLPSAMAEKMLGHRKRLENLRIVLTAHSERHRTATIAQRPASRVAREARF